MWQVEFSRETRNYILDNAGLLEDLFATIDAIAATPDAVTADGATQLSPNILMAKAGQHIIVYRRQYLSDIKLMRVLSIKPVA